MNVKVTKQALLEHAQKTVNIDQLNKRIEEIVDLVVEKNALYGDAWQLYGPLTALIRIREKLVRLDNVIHDNEALVITVKSCNDVAQEINDVIGYALLLSLWIDKHNPKIKRYEEMAEVLSN
jgi:hypothetical protein